LGASPFITEPSNQADDNQRTAACGCKNMEKKEADVSEDHVFIFSLTTKS
jgi:hypothetical protein